MSGAPQDAQPAQIPYHETWSTRWAARSAIAGRRTSVALSLLAPDATEQHPADLNWDDPAVPPRLRSGRLPPGEPLVILDEIHK